MSTDDNQNGAELLMRHLLATGQATTKSPIEAIAQCEFCEIDGLGNHAPRCPVSLERELSATRSQNAELREILVRAKGLLRACPFISDDIAAALKP